MFLFRELSFVPLLAVLTVIISVVLFLVLSRTEERGFGDVGMLLVFLLFIQVVVLG